MTMTPSFKYCMDEISTPWPDDHQPEPSREGSYRRQVRAQICAGQYPYQKRHWMNAVSAREQDQRRGDVVDQVRSDGPAGQAGCDGSDRAVRQYNQHPTATVVRPIASTPRTITSSPTTYTSREKLKWERTRAAWTLRAANASSPSRAAPAAATTPTGSCTAVAAR